MIDITNEPSELKGRHAGAYASAESWARWMTDLRRSLAARSQFVLFGNIRDQHLVPMLTGESWRMLPTDMVDCLWRILAERGYEALLVYDRINGLSVQPDDRYLTMKALLEDANESVDLDARPSLTDLVGIITSVTAAVDFRVAVVIDYASRLSEQPQEPVGEVFEFFVACEQLSHAARKVTIDGTSLYNPVFWLANQEHDLPDWLLVGNEMIRSLHIPLPELETRRQVATMLCPRLVGYGASTLDARQKLLDSFAQLTEGMPIKSLHSIVALATDSCLPFSDLMDAVLSYKVGIPENPWRKGYVKRRVEAAEVNIRQQVMGQRKAITKTLDILKRSVMDLSGSQGAAASSKPRGVLFFAGPTGVGKTLLAKTISKEILGNEEDYIRFDMSEFSAEHAQDRLLGAPPGYVGYDAGGELTNAIRQRPFSVVLFDEIEKAHDRLLDKFLQILDDGRLTDGRGNTVYFSEAVIVFTSNLGIYVEKRVGDRIVREPNFTMDDPPEYQVVEERVRNAIKDYFTYKLNRPEILNRIGDNIVVFDFIRPAVSAEIFDRSLDNVIERVNNRHGLALRVPDGIRKELLGVCTKNLSDGGRGIGNVLETAFINPLARSLFAKSLQPGFDDLSEIGVVSLQSGEDGYEVVLE